MKGTISGVLLDDPSGGCKEDVDDPNPASTSRIRTCRVDGSAEHMQPIPEERLGMEWNSFPDDIQVRRMSTFFSALLRFICDLCEPTVVAEIPLSEDQQQLFAAGKVAKRRGRYVFKLTPEFSDVLPQLFIVWMQISCEGECRPVMVLHDSWEGVFLFIDSTATNRLTHSLSASGLGPERIGAHPALHRSR
jgi:hypothetical protein